MFNDFHEGKYLAISLLPKQMRFRHIPQPQSYYLTHHLAFTKFTSHLKWSFGTAVEKIHDKITSNGFSLQIFRVFFFLFKIALRVTVNNASEYKT